MEKTLKKHEDNMWALTDKYVNSLKGNLIVEEQIILKKDEDIGSDF